MKNIILIMGVAGAGKSCQGKLLADDLGYRWLSIGELLRAHMEGEKQQAMLHGHLLNDNEVIALVNETLTGPDQPEGWIIDGFPRTTYQADWFLEQVAAHRFEVHSVVHLLVEQAEAQERLLKRGRPDDTLPVVALRLQEYQQVSLPVIARFRTNNIPVHDIDGNQPIEAVHHDITLAVKGVLKRHDDQS